MLLPLPALDRRPLAGAERILLGAAMLLVWFLAWAHPLYPPDEGRYGSASATMAESGQWLVPYFRGHAHLTKPPLTYWLEAIGVLSFGRTEMAVRLPSLLATSAALFVLFRFARRALGTRPALVAVALTSVMPLVLFVGRLASTDALLALTWIVMLYAGYRIASQPKERAMLVAFWVAQALGFMVKGPAALGPLVIIVVWLVLARRWRDIARFMPWFGLPIALVPLVAWIALIAMRYPEVGRLWWDETIGRAIGEKELRAEPFWFYVPVFFAGLYPATTMLALPIVNLRWRSAWEALRGGDIRALCLAAVLLPLFGLSLSTGKMPTYVLPLAAPTAILASITIERWLRGEFDRANVWAELGYRPPDVRRTLAIVAIIVFVVELVGAIVVAKTVPELWPLVVPLAIVPIGCIVLWRLWNVGGPLAPHMRLRGCAIAWVAFAAGWTLTFGIEARYASAMGSDTILAQARSFVGIERPQVVLIGFVDPTYTFYNGGKFTLEDIGLETLVGRKDLDYPIVVLVDEESVARIIEDAPDVAVQLERLRTLTRWFGRPTRIYKLMEPLPKTKKGQSASAGPIGL